MKNQIKDRVYKLTRERAPLSYIIPPSGGKKPILWWDDKKKINRELRYSKNQRSCFVDEQDGQINLEHIDFVDGFLRVPKENRVLQQFLYLHPLNTKVYEEVNEEKDATKELEQYDIAFEAESQARKLDITQLEHISRVLLGVNPSTMSTAELRRDLIVNVNRYPEEFMKVINDPMLKLQSQVKLFFDKSLLGFRKNQKEVWFNLKTNKNKMLTVPFGEDPVYIVASYLQSDEGIESLKLLETVLESEG